jgi:hypothetical protein
MGRISFTEVNQLLAKTTSVYNNKFSEKKQVCLNSFVREAFSYQSPLSSKERGFGSRNELFEGRVLFGINK